MKIPPSQPPQKGEKKQSIAQKIVLTREVAAPEKQETEKRAKKSSAEAKPVEQKALEQRTTEASTLQDLPPEVLNYMMTEFGDLASLAQLSATSTDFLTTISANVDFKRLAQLNKNNQLSLKDQIAYAAFALFSGSGTSVGEMKKLTTLNPEASIKDITPEKIAEVKANYSQFQSIMNTLVGELVKTLGPGATIDDIKDIVKNAAPYALLGLLSTVGATVSGMELQSPAYIMAALPYVAAATALGLGVTNYFGQFALFKTTTTNMLNSLTS